MTESITNKPHSEASRDHAIDTAKGILIIMVVYAHCFTDGILHDFFFSFHMPAFFVLSGITASLSGEMNKPTKQVLLRMLVRIGVPFLFFEFLGAVQFFIRFGFKQNLFGLLFNALIMQCNNIVDWFLYALFFAKLLNRFLLFLCTKAFHQKAADYVYLAISLILLVVAVVIPMPKNDFLGILRTTLISHAFLASGYVLASFYQKKRTVWGLVSLVLALALSLWNMDCPDIYELRFGYPAVFLCAAFLGSYGVLQISERWSCKVLRWLGYNSIIIMGTHIPILLIARFISHTVAPTLWIRIADFFIILSLEIPIVYLIRKKAPFLIGKRKESVLL